MKENIQDIIDQYLLRKLKGEELAQFEKQLSENPELAQDVKEQQKALEMIELVGDEEIRSRVKSVHEKMKNKPKPRRNGRLFFLVAIAAVLAFFLIWNSLSQENKNTSEEIYAAYFEPFYLDMKRGEEEATLKNANEFYSKKEYKKAIPLLEKVSKRSDDTKFDMALGIAYLENGNIAQAIVVFEKILNSDAIYAHHAAWYNALAYLKSNDIETSKKYFSEAARINPSVYREKVNAVLKKLP